MDNISRSVARMNLNWSLDFVSMGFSGMSKYRMWLKFAILIIFGNVIVRKLLTITVGKLPYGFVTPRNFFSQKIWYCLMRSFLKVDHFFTIFAIFGNTFYFFSLYKGIVCFTLERKKVSKYSLSMTTGKNRIFQTWSLSSRNKISSKYFSLLIGWKSLLDIAYINCTVLNLF